MNARGLSLVELLVAMTIGSALIAGAVTVYARCSAVYAVNESIARLQESARFALNTIEADVQLAGFWGLTNSADTMRGTSANAPVTLSSRAARCGSELPLDLRHSLAGTNNGYSMPCPATGGAQPGADVLVIRRADADPARASSERLQVYTSRDGTSDTLFLGDSAPGPVNVHPDFGAVGEVHDLIVRAYYVSPNATGQASVPALRRKTLQGGPSTGPDIADEEIMTGVEDLQVQFGVDAGVDLDGDGAADDSDGDGRPDRYSGIVQRYVDPGDAALSSALIVSARVWIRVRGEVPEAGFEDSSSYTYADVNFRPAGDASRYRRLVVTRTIHRRNARQPGG